MDLEELQAMSDVELNELSAVKVMGWEIHLSTDGKEIHHYKTLGKLIHFNSWSPTENINDAMALVNKTDGDVIIQKSRVNEYCVSVYGEADIVRPSWMDSITRAITIASILAMGDEGE